MNFASMIDRARRRLCRPFFGALPLAAALLLAASTGVHAQAEIPALAGRVNDLADLIPADTESAIDARLAALESETGAQVVVLTVPDLAGDPIEDFGIRLAEAWKIGREGADDGAILIVSRDDRSLRIEVGYGLEPTLTDLAAGRIINETILPRFRAGDFGGGIDAGVRAIEAVVRKEPVALPADAYGASDEGLFRVVFLGVFAVVAWVFATLALVIPGPMAWILYIFMAPFWLLFPGVALGFGWGLVALMLWLIGFPILKLTLGRRMAKAGKKKGKGGFWDHFGPGGGGGWASGGWSSGSSGGGGFSGGGFSGGGGSFGGGGASGGW